MKRRDQAGMSLIELVVVLAVVSAMVTAATFGFSGWAKDQRVKLGEQLQVKAVLVDPELGIMIRGLDNTARKQKKEYPTADGKTITVEQDMSLDPRVVITRADGEKVADGVMPFG